MIITYFPKIFLICWRYIIKLWFKAIKHLLKWFMDDVRFNFCSKVVHANKGQFGFKLWAITLIQIEIFQRLFSRNCSSHIRLKDIRMNFAWKLCGIKDIRDFVVLHYIFVTLYEPRKCRFWPGLTSRFPAGWPQSLGRTLLETENSRSSDRLKIISTKDFWGI